MNILNFENHINKTILQRGYDYYHEGSIIEVFDQGDHEFIFQVQGTEDYEVIVKLDENGEILYSYCDCPYDFGPICKHQVASYFELLEILNSEDNSESMKKEAVKQPDLTVVLNNLSKQELVSIILDITKKDVTLKNSLIVRYSKGDTTQELETCKRLIDSIVNKYTGRDGFIPYRQTYHFVSEMEEIIEIVRGTDDILQALDIAFLLLEEAVEAFQYADDSDGDIGGLVTETIKLIGEMAVDSGDLNEQLREEIFNKIMAQSESELFDGWEDFKLDLLRICVEFADVDALRMKLRMLIENIVSDNSSEYMKYRNEKLLHILFELTEKYGTKKEAEKFIADHLNFTSFREMYIAKCMKEKNYHKVIELALEGEKKDKQYAGLLSKWKKLRYTAYKELSLKEETEKLAKELLFDGGFEYYSELKALVTGDQAVFYNDLKKELKNVKGWLGRSVYLKLIVEENDLDEIMEFVRGNPDHIEDYAELLVDRFKDEVIEIYKKYIRAEASSSSNRKDYQEVCRILTRFKKMAGKNNQIEIINELSAVYKKRSAFVDEMGKI